MEIVSGWITDLQQYLLVMLTLLALFGGPAYPRNEYLNEYGARCGDLEVELTERRDD